MVDSPVVGAPVVGAPVVVDGGSVVVGAPVVSGAPVLVPSVVPVDEASVSLAAVVAVPSGQPDSTGAAQSSRRVSHASRLDMTFNTDRDIEGVSFQRFRRGEALSRKSSQPAT